MITREELTRDDLTAEAPEGGLSPFHNVVAGATGGGSVVLASNGHLRTVEFWTRGDEIVLLGVAEPDEPRLASHMSGGDAVTAWLELVMRDARWWPESGSSDGSIAGVDSEIERIVKGAGGESAVLVVERAGLRRALLRVDSNGGTRWARVDSGGAASLSASGMATYVASVLELGPERRGSAEPTAV